MRSTVPNRARIEAGLAIGNRRKRISQTPFGDMSKFREAVPSVTEEQASFQAQGLAPFLTHAIPVINDHTDLD